MAFVKCMDIEYRGRNSRDHFQSGCLWNRCSGHDDYRSTRRKRKSFSGNLESALQMCAGHP
ncbi:Hypothetical protein SMAX5B_018988 [Scophthalmus maximus]|uniref:Uncharacterized protein n=1 Tax=Scophthalmus maximus TaxID=52904 RepID=A0A2U9C6H6_SCOMX|nr:Hypothetical protein SMAX5B_018988 [Scophthalmus maximus]